MPIYEYDCNGCAEAFEELVFGADTEVRCPACGGADVTRKLSAFAFRSGGRFVSSHSCGGSCGGCSSGGGSGCGCGGKCGH